jgi:hypothetical protein
LDAVALLPVEFNRGVDSAVELALATIFSRGC